MFGLVINFNVFNCVNIKIFFNHVQLTSTCCKDEKCQAHYKENRIRENTCRYIIRLPFTEKVKTTRRIKKSLTKILLAGEKI